MLKIIFKEQDIICKKKGSEVEYIKIDRKLLIKIQAISRILFLMLFYSFNFKITYAQNIFEYQTYFENDVGSSSSSAPLNSFTIVIDELKNNQRTVKWSKQEGQGINTELYILDKEWATVQWEVNDPVEQIQYSATRSGNKLYMDGKIKDKNTKKEIPIDSDPFYFNPKLGLRFFVESGKQSATFWAMRHDNMDVFKMKAVNKGIEIINVNGKKVEAVRVDWSAFSGFSKYFNRTYWFRRSDNVYVKQKVIGSKVRALVNER